MSSKRNLPSYIPVDINIHNILEIYSLAFWQSFLYHNRMLLSRMKNLFSYMERKKTMTLLYHALSMSNLRIGLGRVKLLSVVLPSVCIHINIKCYL